LCLLSWKGRERHVPKGKGGRSPGEGKNGIGAKKNVNHKDRKGGKQPSNGPGLEGKKRKKGTKNNNGRGKRGRGDVLKRT